MRARTSFTRQCVRLCIDICTYECICVRGEADTEPSGSSPGLEPLQKRSILDSQRFITSSNMAPIPSLFLASLCLSLFVPTPFPPSTIPFCLCCSISLSPSSSWIFEDRFPRQRAGIRILLVDYLFPYSEEKWGREGRVRPSIGFTSWKWLSFAGFALVRGFLRLESLDQLTAEIDPGIEYRVAEGGGKRIGASLEGFPSYPFGSICRYPSRSSRCYWMFFVEFLSMEWPDVSGLHVTGMKGLEYG